MCDSNHKNSIQDLNIAIMGAIQEADRYFSVLTENERPGRISLPLMTECCIHAIAFGQIAADLAKELLVWDLAHGAEPLTPTEQVGWDLAVKSLDHCVKAMQIDQTGQFFEAGVVILNGVFALTGADWIVKTLDFLKTLNDSWDIPTKDLKTTSKFLDQFDLFMMIGLLASQYAVMQVNALTHPLDDFMLGLPLAFRAKKALGESQARVSGVVLDVRRDFDQNIEHSGGKFLVYFPTRGMWPDA
ncbi:MAG: hypothetical protein ABSG51_04505 [Terracidiphilus sp.]|jgi:hypothetical protein